MIIIKDYITILNFIDNVKGYKKGLITNFFYNEHTIPLWIEDNLLKHIQFGETIFIIKDNGNFNSLFYIASSETDLKNALNTLLIKYPDFVYVVDVILKNQNFNIKNIFTELNFDEYNSLVRMSRFGECTDCEFDKTVTKANITHLKDIKLLLDNNFDALAEQLPTNKELASYINNGKILIYEHKNQIAGFIIYDYNSFSLHLKYWFVSPKFRNQKIGSKLFKQFLFEGKNTKKQFCWVIESNDNAIKKYVHYGFNKENTFDKIMIKR